MKRIFFTISIVCFLNGCTLAPNINQQQQEFGDKPYKAQNGKTLTVNGLRDDYKKQTGMNLIGPDTRSCGWNETCYQNAWAEAYEKDINAFNYKKRLEEKKIAESKCLADKECKRSKDLLEARKGLSWGYTMLLGINPYSQADSDYLVRNICEKVTASQKDGVSRDVLIKKMRDLPGIAPRERGILTEIVGSCWDISKLSGDWREAIRQN